MSCDYRVSNLFKAIQRRSLELVRIYENAGLLPKLSRDIGPCVDCGVEQRGGGFCYEHRDYSDALAVRRVCLPCNKLSKKATAYVIDPDSLEKLAA